MLPLRRYSLFVLLIFFSLLVHSQTENIDSIDIKERCFYLPYQSQPWKYKSTLSVSNFFLPSDWTSLSVQAPMANYSARFSFPKRFALESSLQTLIIASKFSIGPSWSVSWNRLHLGAAMHVGLNLGFLEQQSISFATLTYGVTFNPLLRFGYSFNKYCLTAQVGMDFLNDITYLNSGNHFVYKVGSLNGWNTMLTLEQKLWKNRIFTFGAGFNYVNYLIISWPAYPVNNRRYVVPQINFGLNF